MINIYKTNTKTGVTENESIISKGCWINLINPDENEIERVCRETDISDRFIKYSLDYEEKARIDREYDEDTILYIIDTPTIESENYLNTYYTVPMGIIFVRDDYIITVAAKENTILYGLEKKLKDNSYKDLYTYKKSRLLLQLMYDNSAEFLKILTRINKESEIAENILNKSLENKQVLQLLNLQKGLVYLTTSLKSNETVMERTLRGKIVKLYAEDQELLEDSIIENRQAIEMSQIYSNILGTTMEAYASIISNNLNGVMKILTSITIIIAIPTLIASFWGMNVPVPFQYNRWGFVITILISFLLGIIATIWLKKKKLLN